MDKIDLRKELEAALPVLQRRPSSEVQVPAFTFLMIDGQGDPNHSPAYARSRRGAVLGLVYGEVHGEEGAGRQDYAVMPLEGLWWADDLTAFQTGDRANWHWTMMIMQPAFVPASRAARGHGGSRREEKACPAVARLRIENFEEGPLRADPARRAVSPKRARPSSACTPFIESALRPARQTPRDLPDGYPACRSRALEDHHPPADEMNRCPSQWRSIMAR